MGLRLHLNPRAKEGPDKGRTMGGRGGKEKKEREYGYKWWGKDEELEGS